jgi:hypothetical protein
MRARLDLTEELEFCDDLEIIVSTSSGRLSPKIRLTVSWTALEVGGRGYSSGSNASPKMRLMPAMTAAEGGPRWTGGYSSGSKESPKMNLILAMTEADDDERRDPFGLSGFGSDMMKTS